MISQEVLFKKLRSQRKALNRIISDYKLDKKIKDSDINLIENMVRELDSIIFELSSNRL